MTHHFRQKVRNLFNAFLAFFHHTPDGHSQSHYENQGNSLPNNVEITVPN